MAYVSRRGCLPLPFLLVSLFLWQGIMLTTDHSLGVFFGEQLRFLSKFLNPQVNVPEVSSDVFVEDKHLWSILVLFQEPSPSHQHWSFLGWARVPMSCWWHFSVSQRQTACTARLSVGNAVDMPCGKELLSLSKETGSPWRGCCPSCTPDLFLLHLLLVANDETAA